jgi:hypothetical protein
MTKLPLFLMTGLWAAAGLWAQVPDIYTQEMHGDPPFLSQPEWKPLLNGRDLSGWHSADGKPHEWVATRSVNFKRIFDPKRLVFSPEPGDRIVNGKKGVTSDLMTDEKFGDCELYLEFMMARGSNSGVFLHSHYEVQIFDSYGYTGHLQVGDNGGIYRRLDGTGGAPPRVNASRPPGDWQSLQVWFRAPRFDASGKKISNALFLRVLLNEVLVQENVEMQGPTGRHFELPEATANPLFLQGDHGPVAFRNIYIRPLQPAAAAGH